MQWIKKRLYRWLCGDLELLAQLALDTAVDAAALARQFEENPKLLPAQGKLALTKCPPEREHKRGKIRRKRIPPMPGLVTSGHIARRLGITDTTVREWSRQGKIPSPVTRTRGYGSGTAWWAKADIDKWILQKSDGKHAA